MTTTVTEAHNAFAGQGAVLLDIGGDVGALVVTMPESAVGLEVEIRPIGDENVPAHAHEHADGHVHAHAHTGHAHLAHVAVVSRPVGDGHLPSLVFAELQEGTYDLFEKGCPDAIALTVEVAGGEVTTAAWPASS